MWMSVCLMLSQSSLNGHKIGGFFCLFFLFSLFPITCLQAADVFLFTCYWFLLIYFLFQLYCILHLCFVLHYIFYVLDRNFWLLCVALSSPDFYLSVFMVITSNLCWWIAYLYFIWFFTEFYLVPLFGTYSSVTLFSLIFYFYREFSMYLVG